MVREENGSTMLLCLFRQVTTKKQLFVRIEISIRIVVTITRFICVVAISVTYLHIKLKKIDPVL